MASKSKKEDKNEKEIEVNFSFLIFSQYRINTALTNLNHLRHVTSNHFQQRENNTKYVKNISPNIYWINQIAFSKGMCGGWE